MDMNRSAAKSNEVIREVIQDLLEEYPHLAKETSVEELAPLLAQHNKIEELEAIDVEAKAHYERYNTHLRRAARWERLEYLTQTKILERAMQDSDAEAVKTKYEQLVRCESESFFQ